jgi:hypothetical protein
MAEWASSMFLGSAMLPVGGKERLSVKQALASGRWMKGLQNFNSEEQLDQFIELWTRL